MKAQSVVYNCIILSNLEKERTSIQFNFLKLNPSSRPILTSPPYGPPPLEWKKNSNLPQKLF